MDASRLRRPTIRPLNPSPFYDWGVEDPELTRAIWHRLFRLQEEDLMALYFCDYSRLWELLEMERPEWWTGNFADIRHELYRRPISRFVSQCYAERPQTKWLHTQHLHTCTSAEFDEKWRTGEFYEVYSHWA